MPPPSVPPPSTDLGRYEMKGSSLRGLLAAIHRAGLGDEVLAHLPPEIHAVALDPPSSTAWIDGRITAEMMVAIDKARGPRTVRALTAQSLLLGLGPMLAPIAEGIVRLFGPTPQQVLPRAGLLAKPVLRGVNFVHAATGPRSCTVDVQIPSRADLPEALWVSYGGTFEAMLEFCAVAGSVSPHEPVEIARGGAARYALRW